MMDSVLLLSVPEPPPDGEVQLTRYSEMSTPFDAGCTHVSAIASEVVPAIRRSLTPAGSI